MPDRTEEDGTGLIVNHIPLVGVSNRNFHVLVLDEEVNHSAVDEGKGERIVGSKKLRIPTIDELNVRLNQFGFGVTNKGGMAGIREGEEVNVVVHREEIKTQCPLKVNKN